MNRTYADMAAHYRTAIIPARPYKPRDKAKVEVGVQPATSWHGCVIGVSSRWPELNRGDPGTVINQRPADEQYVTERSTMEDYVLLIGRSFS